MLTNKLTLTFVSNKTVSGTTLCLNDRFGSLNNNLSFAEHTEATTTFDILFPNTLCIEIKNSDHNECVIHLKSMSLSGLALPENILDQICHYRPLDSDVATVTRHWHQIGAVTIDFFAANWVQYHLLYGNKIIKL
jgi:hypothetical protein